MNKFFLFIPILLYSTNISLKKDEIYQYKTDYLNFSHLLKIRWTLYVNKCLTILYNYDNFPYQVILKKEYPKNIIRIPISNIYKDFPIYIYIIFREFKNNRAYFEIKESR